MSRCKAKTADGTRCQNMANERYGDYCGVHKNLYSTQFIECECESAQKTRQIKNQASEIKDLKKKVRRDAENKYPINLITDKPYFLKFF